MTRRIERAISCFPRASGDRPRTQIALAYGDEFPPRERGSTRDELFPDGQERSFPRASGDRPDKFGTGGTDLLFPPRERGSTRDGTGRDYFPKVSPARAGIDP